MLPIIMLFLLGYYRVNYDRPNWIALARVLSESTNTIHLLNRAQLVDDAFNLARNGRLVSIVLYSFFVRIVFTSIKLGV